MILRLNCMIIAINFMLKMLIGNKILKSYEQNRGILKFKPKFDRANLCKSYNFYVKILANRNEKTKFDNNIIDTYHIKMHNMTISYYSLAVKTQARTEIQEQQ